MAEESERKVALVTGASRGLGRRIGLELVHESYALALTARSFEELEQTRQLSGLAPRDALIVLADLGDNDAPEQVFGATLEHFGRLDVLINAARTTVPKLSLSDLEGTDQDRLLAINLRAPIALARMAARQMRKNEGGGTIINFVHGTNGACDPVTAAVDAGIFAFSRIAATAWHAHQIKVAAIKAASIIAAGSQTRGRTASQARPIFIEGGSQSQLQILETGCSQPCTRAPSHVRATRTASQVRPSFGSAVEEVIAFVRASRDRQPIAVTLED